MHTSPGRGLLPKVRAMMVASCPDVELELRQVALERPHRRARRPQHRCRVRVAAAAGAAVPMGDDRARAAAGGAAQRPPRWPPATSVSIADLLDEPFLALPESAGPLRDYWLALDERDGHPPRIAAEINDTEETYEAVAERNRHLPAGRPATPRSSTAAT